MTNIQLKYSIGDTLYVAGRSYQPKECPCCHQEVYDDDEIDVSEIKTWKYVICGARVLVMEDWTKVEYLYSDKLPCYELSHAMSINEEDVRPTEAEAIEEYKQYEELTKEDEE